jgi:hypothetical protein
MGPWLGTDMPDSAECPIADFRAKLVAVDAACCAEPGSCSGPDAGAGACALGCAAKLLPLYSTCNRTMTQLLDDMDGVTDGVAQIVETMRGACLSVPSTSIIDEMIRMRDEDGCTIHGDGVGEEVVVTAPNGCSDTDATLCGLVDSGLLSCEDDFCPDCTNAHKCDATCTFDCAPADAGKDGKGHRRAQIHLDNACSPLNLEDKVGPVNDACWYVRRTHLALSSACLRNVSSTGCTAARLLVRLHVVVCTVFCKQLQLMVVATPVARLDAVMLGVKVSAKVAAMEFRRSVMCSVRWRTPPSSTSVSAPCGCRSIRPQSQPLRALPIRATRSPWPLCFRAWQRLRAPRRATGPQLLNPQTWTVSGHGSTRASTARLLS